MPTLEAAPMPATPPTPIPDIIAEELKAQADLLALAAQIQQPSASDEQRRHVSSHMSELDAQTQRDSLLLDNIRTERAEQQRRATMAAEARKLGRPLPAVSATPYERVQDPSVMAGLNGQNLIEPGYVGIVVNQDERGNGGKKTNRHVAAQLSRHGAKLVLREDGTPWMSDMGVGVMIPIETSARDLAHFNALRVSEEDLNQELAFAATYASQGMITSDASAAETAFVDRHAALAESGAPSRQPAVSGRSSISHDLTPPAPTITV